eukprot:14630184-Ditylum_brightwellii.AAC.1
MGVMKLPSKVEYWFIYKYMSSHPIARELGMSGDYIAFIRRHFHVYEPDEEELNAKCKEEDDADISDNEEL